MTERNTLRAAAVALRASPGLTLGQDGSCPARGGDDTPSRPQLSQDRLVPSHSTAGPWSLAHDGSLRNRWACARRASGDSRAERMSQSDDYWKPQRNVLIKGGGKRPHLGGRASPVSCDHEAHQPAGPLAQARQAPTRAAQAGVLRLGADSKTPAHLLHRANAGHGIAR